MSLFKSRELWSTFCGKEEQFDNGCMTVADILGQGFECIVVGSHSGFLRIFQPEADSECDAEGYRPTDLLIETQLPQPVIQVAIGKLVSGSQSTQIGVLHPHSMAVYSLVEISGSAQHGDQYHLVMAYEHQLSRSSYSFLVGPFGGAKGRDFICIQSLDGTLSFFEQETFAVNRSLPCFLLPSPFVYVPSSDSFVVLNANWILECYRYEVLADLNRKLVAWWTLNLGEPVVSMEVVATQGSKSAIFVLGERNLYCLREGGSIELAKRLQFIPCCLHPYVTEPERKAMALVVADTATLLVYDMATLCWSSQLPFIPVVISRVNFKGLQGLVALLSEEGQVVCCYLGTEPAVFVPPPVLNKAHSYRDLQQRLLSLQQEIDASSQSKFGILDVPRWCVVNRELAQHHIMYRCGCHLSTYYVNVAAAAAAGIRQTLDALRAATPPATTFHKSAFNCHLICPQRPSELFDNKGLQSPR
ncbi:Protein PTHB1 [Homalodisca vitripennis]|nr:Protein PTHB1 [Homalodisca vitripennis]